MGARGAHQSFHALYFRLERLAAGASQPVVAAPLVNGIRGTIAFFDPARLHQPLERAVDRAGSQANRTVGVPQNVLENAVAVTVAAGEREEGVEDRRRQRWERSAGLCIRHGHNISVTDISVNA